MSLKIPVVDRVSAYPGRVKMTPVTGETNMYTMERADSPITEGTLINKALFDNKAYTLTRDAIVYVSTVGDDANGDGTSAAPYRTIQKAIDSIPKHLGGHKAEISVDFGVYDEKIVVESFTAGRLVIGRPGEVFTINAIDIVNSSYVETNIYQIDKVTGNTGALFTVKDGSIVFIGSDMILNGVSGNIVGITAENGSHVVTKGDIDVVINNCTVALTAIKCAFVCLATVKGTGNIFGLSASQGSIVSYSTDAMEKAWSHNADSGGLVLTDKNSSDLSGATIEL